MIKAHTYILQSCTPKRTRPSFSAPHLEGKSCLPWDQGLYSFQLYPSGIPSQQDYLHSRRSKLYAHLLQFAAECGRARPPPTCPPRPSSLLQRLFRKLATLITLGSGIDNGSTSFTSPPSATSSTTLPSIRGEGKVRGRRGCTCWTWEREADSSRIIWLPTWRGGA